MAARKERFAPYDIFESTKESLGVSAGELSELLGYGNATYHGWKTNKKMPYVASLACDALLAAKKSDTGNKVILSVELKEPGQLASLKSFLSAFALSAKIIDV